ncbi:MAG: hypothetical protein ACF8XB_07055 [Planctomycetota bacterium JB042]
MIRTVLTFVLVGALGVSGYIAYDRFTERQQLLRVIDRLTTSSRVAQAVVTKRWTEADGTVRTAVRFVELDDDGEPLAAPTEFVVDGETVYFDAYVLKFEHGLVTEGDAMKGRSLVLFRRAFGEHQEPAEGHPLDEAAEDGVPAAYRGDDPPGEAEKALWADFWRYANDPKAAEKAGIRVAQGEAPSMKMAPGKLYDLSVDHAGGLNITVSKVPAVLVGEDS